MCYNMWLAGGNLIPRALHFLTESLSLSDSLSLVPESGGRIAENQEEKQRKLREEEQVVQKNFYIPRALSLSLSRAPSLHHFQSSCNWPAGHHNPSLVLLYLRASSLSFSTVPFADT